VWEQENAIPDLDGSDQTVAWATQIRYDLLAVTLSTTRDEPSRDALLRQARAVTAAGWWIDHRHIEASRLFPRPNSLAADQRKPGLR
jgi:hypothetical protein